MYDRFIRSSAKQWPYDIAASSGHSHVSYARMDADVDRLAHALDREGLKPGALAGIGVTDPYLHLLLTLACARLRVATASLAPALLAAMANLTEVDVVICDDAAGGGADLRARRIAVGGAWIEAALAAEAPSPWRSPEVDPAGLARVQLSSGTTGTPKATEMSWRLVEDRVLQSYGLSPVRAGRMLSMIGPESGAIQVFIACWATRGCVLFPPADIAPLAAALPALAPNNLFGTPVQLDALLKAMPRDATPLPDLMVAVAGGGAPRGLVADLRERLSARVALAYASTEAGVCASADASRLPGAPEGAVGWISPIVELQVVDEASAPCPPGVMGRVRVRGPSLVAGYRNDAALTAERFREGWFYPGDLGSLDGADLLTIHGREDEVMNFGGVKFLPEALEACVRDLPGVLDVAAFSLEDAQGQPQPWLAIVRGQAFDERAVAPALQLPELPPVRIAWIDTLPRTLTGKVKREDLKAAARTLQAKPPAAG